MPTLLWAKDGPHASPAWACLDSVSRSKLLGERAAHAQAIACKPGVKRPRVGGVTSRGVRANRSTGLGLQPFFSSHSAASSCPSAAAKCLQTHSQIRLGASQRRPRANLRQSVCLWLAEGPPGSPGVAVAAKHIELAAQLACWLTIAVVVSAGVKVRSCKTELPMEHALWECDRGASLPCHYIASIGLEKAVCLFRKAPRHKLLPS
jgi:hypothetical protein